MLIRVLGDQNKKRHMEILSLLFIWFFLIVLNANASCPELSYSLLGNHAAFKNVTVVIDTSGSVRVSIIRFQNNQSIANSYATVLAGDEIALLNSAITSSGFFDLQFPSAGQLIPDAGRTTLTIKTPSVQRSITYTYIPQLSPIENFLTRIITQSHLLDSP